MRETPNTKNYKGQERKIGLEIEYAGLTLKKTADIIYNLFGGEIEELNRTIFNVKNTQLGDFTIELDAIPLQKAAKKLKMNEENIEERLNDRFSIHASRALITLGEKVVPFEIVSPPIKLSDLQKIEALRQALFNAGAKDTKEAFYSAFGLHINPEVSSIKSHYITRHIQSFLLLLPLLKKLHNIDLTRKITTFIDPFPDSYLKLVLTKGYTPDIDELIIDYHTHNPTRNRALDMLPLFAYINEKLVRELYGMEEKINKRPTFHYRLPNCELSDEGWSFNMEWERWLKVEKLATNISLLNQLIELWQTHQQHWISLESSWLKEIEKHEI